MNRALTAATALPPASAVAQTQIIPVPQTMDGPGVVITAAQQVATQAGQALQQAEAATPSPAAQEGPDAASEATRRHRWRYRSRRREGWQ